MTKVLIIGGGVFGLSTALELANGKYQEAPHQILVIDRAAEPPEEDAACSDINKIVRGDYSDGTYAELAQRCLDKWQNNPEWQPYFHQSGIVVAASTPDSHGELYVRKSYSEQSKLYSSGRSATPPRLITSQKEYDSALLGDVSSSPLSDKEEVEIGPAPPVAYWNRNSGWAASGDAMKALYKRCKSAGVSFAQAQVSNLLIEDGDVRGAVAEDGREFRSEGLTMLCAGSWSPMIFPELGKGIVASGQVLATIQLTEQEAARYSKTPVYIDMQTGYYMFPPTSSGVIKVALHTRGYSNYPSSPSVDCTPPASSVSIPRTAHFHGSHDEHIPLEAVRSLRENLKRVYPELGARKEFTGTRMCWYADSKDCDWLIDWHNQYKSLFLATGDSGHAFKFLPIMGELVVSAIERTLPPHLQHAWSCTRERKEYKPDRGTSVLTPLKLDALAQAGDLRPDEAA